MRKCFLQVAVVLLSLLGCSTQPHCFYENGADYKVAHSLYENYKKHGDVRTPIEWMHRLRAEVAIPNINIHTSNFRIWMWSLYLMPVVEPPSFWADLVDDERLPKPARRKFLFALLNRHLRPGMRVTHLRNICAGRKWFSTENIVVPIYDSDLPFNSMRGVHFKFSLPFMKEEHSSVFLKLDGSISKEGFLELMTATNQPSGLRIAEFTLDERIAENR